LSKSVKEDILLIVVNQLWTRGTTMSILDQVNAFLDTTKDAREYKRAMAVKLLLLEFEPHDIAELLHVTESFVSKWKGLCFEHGVDALC
jgi:putative transposase